MTSHDDRRSSHASKLSRKCVTDNLSVSSSAINYSIFFFVVADGERPPRPGDYRNYLVWPDLVLGDGRIKSFHVRGHYNLSNFEKVGQCFGLRCSMIAHP